MWSPAVFGGEDGNLKPGNDVKNRSCAIGVYGYVGTMNWQQFLPLVIVLIAVVLFVWRSSGKKSGDCGCKNGCSHEHESEAKKPNAVR
jgi:hypothetical protein